MSDLSKMKERIFPKNKTSWIRIKTINQDLCFSSLGFNSKETKALGFEVQSIGYVETEPPMIEALADLMQEVLSKEMDVDIQSELLHSITDKIATLKTQFIVYKNEN